MIAYTMLGAQLLSLALLLVVSMRGAAQDNSADALIGLWKASHRCAPNELGTLLLWRTDDGWIAGFEGGRFPVARDSSVLRFELPNHQGSFRARLDASGREAVKGDGNHAR